MQVVPALFNTLAAGSVVPLSWELRISFSKAFDVDVEFFTLDQSVLDGIDILSPSDDNPLQEWDYYEYLPYTDRVVDMEWTREVEFPYSLTSAMADFTLNNFDDYFSPNGGSSIEEFILPKRPLRILAGYGGINIQQFVGMTETMPDIADGANGNKVIKFHALDFLAEMYTIPLDQTIAMRDVRTDEVLAELFQQFGLAPSQYSLAKARNVIPFLFFEKGANAGDILRRLMQAEMGNLWLSETGIIHFEQRLLPVEDPVFTFDDTNIINITTPGQGEIINKVKIFSELREVQEFQPIWAKSISSSTSDLLVIPAGGTLEVEADLQDPLLSAVEPTLGFSSSISWFTAVTAEGANVPSDVAVISSELRANNYIMTFENTNAFPVEINEAEVWGEPAKVYDRIEYEAIDQDSIDKYGEMPLEITNDFFQSLSNCESFAYTLLDSYAEYAGIIDIAVKGNVALQLGDVVAVDALTYDNNYKIVKIVEGLIGGVQTQIIRARLYEPREWFQLDVSVLDGVGVLAP